jgi:cytochrome c-type biogenesis protein CcmF
VLVLSSFQIIFSTSIPIINAIFGSNMAPPVNVVEYYNNWQLPFAVVVAIMIAFTHYIKWGRNQTGSFFRAIAFSLTLSLVFTVIFLLIMNTRGPGHILMLFSSLFALFSSLDLLLRFRKRFAPDGAVLTHLGMALFFLAVLLTFSQKETISRNTSGYSLGQAFPDSENLLLIKDNILPMGEYFVTYKGYKRVGNKNVYQIDFLKKKHA